MAKIQVRNHGKSFHYIHNDLLNGAFHFKNVVDQKVNAGDRAGIAFDCMACLIMLAFAFEAHLNFYGDKKLKKWNELEKFHVKLKSVMAEFQIEYDEQKMPFKAILELNEFRNMIAHGKPNTESFDQTVEINEEHVTKLRSSITPKWEEYCTPPKVDYFYRYIDEASKLLLEKSGMDLFDTLSGGGSMKELVG